MKRAKTIVLVGIGGYGNSYVSELLDSPNQELFKIVGAVDPHPGSCKRLSELEGRQVSVYPNPEAFYANHRPDLAIISSPLRFHAAQTELALGSGSHVLCEKPLCPTPEEAREMLAAQKQTGKHVAIGYQWSFSRAIQHLKSDILSGKLGKPIRFRTLVLWPRDEVYYHRNDWAGAKKAADGAWILDSPVSNACSHFFHNMLYLLGDRLESAVTPESVVAELYRAYPIENYDTAAVRCRTAEGVEVLFFTSHAVGIRRGPEFIFEFENATVQYSDGPSSPIVAEFRDGTIFNYSSPNDDRMRKLWLTMDLISRGEESLCGIAAAAAHTRCCWAIQQSSSEIAVFPNHLVHAEGAPGQQQLIVDGLAPDLTACYQQGRLPSEIGFLWANRGKTISLNAEPSEKSTNSSKS